MAMGLRGDRRAVKQIDVCPVLSLLERNLRSYNPHPSAKIETDDQEMWESEKHHLNVMSTLQTQHQVRPTLMYPLWKVMALGLGAGTGLIGREAAMACTEAVETVIGEHYDE